RRPPVRVARRSGAVGSGVPGRGRSGPRGTRRAGRPGTAGAGGGGRGGRPPGPPGGGGAPPPPTPRPAPPRRPPGPGPAGRGGEPPGGGRGGAGGARRAAARVGPARHAPIELVHAADEGTPAAPHLERTVLVQPAGIAAALRRLAGAGPRRLVGAAAHTGNGAARPEPPDTGYPVRMPTLNANDEAAVPLEGLVEAGSPGAGRSPGPRRGGP